jgi:hypothetical protein
MEKAASRPYCKGNGMGLIDNYLEGKNHSFGAGVMKIFKPTVHIDIKFVPLILIADFQLYIIDSWFCPFKNEQLSGGIDT